MVSTSLNVAIHWLWFSETCPARCTPSAQLAQRDAEAPGGGGGGSAKSRLSIISTQRQEKGNSREIALRELGRLTELENYLDKSIANRAAYLFH